MPYHNPSSKLYISIKDFNWQEWSLDDDPILFKTVYGKYQRQYYRQDPHLSQTITKYVWSPILFRHGIRIGDNFIQSNWCVLDIDDTLTFKEALEVFGDFQHIIATSKSHTDIYTSLKICIPWAYPIKDAGTYTHSLKHYIKMTGSDDSCSDSARFFWPCREIVSLNFSGKKMPVLEEPDRFKHKPEPFDKNSGAMPPWILKKLTQYTPKGARHKRLFNLSCDFGRLGYDETEAGRIIGQHWNIEGSIDEEDFARHVKNGVAKGKAECR